MWNQVWHILSELSPWLLLGAFVAGLLRLFVPAGRLKRLLRGRGSLLASVLVGIPLPLCSCSVIPVGLGLRREGASRGAALGFLISTPQTGVDSILVSGSLLGWPFALFKVGAALVMGVVGGALVETFGEKEAPTDIPESCESTEDRPMSGRVRDAAAHSIDLIRSIWRWLVFGIFVSAAISSLLPASRFSEFAGESGLAAMFLTLLVSLPLYVCATASVPIAAALVGSGFPAGAAMVFLMAGPATNLATLGAVFRTFGLRSTLLYLLTMVGGSMTAGLLFDALLPSAAVASWHAHEPVGWPAAVSAVVLTGLLLWFAMEDVQRFLARRRASADDLVLRVHGMKCEGCASGLEREVRQIDGVRNVSVQFSTERATISGNPDRKAILEVISRRGFTAEPISEASEKAAAGH